MEKRDFRIRLSFLAMLALAQSASGIMSRWTPLKRASYSGDVEKVHELLEGGTNANGELDHGLTPLHWAATRGHKRVAEILLANGADPNIDRTDAHCDFAVGTPLHCAAFNGHVDIVRLLMANGADINYKTVIGYSWGTALHEAARGGQNEIVELLIVEGADVNAKTHKGKTALHFARNGNTARVLITYGADVRIQDENGKSPLDYAIRNSRADVVRELLENGVKPSLHSAAMLGRLETVLDLIAGGADVNARDMLKRTPLHLAVTGEIAEVLIANGSDINCKNGGHSGTPLMEAARAGRENIVEILLSNGADMNVHNRWGLTAMHNAIRNGHKDIVEIFITRGFDVKVIGAELVFTAAAAGKCNVLPLLHEHDAEIDTKAKNEYTPLHIAVFMGHTDVVEWLIDKGADINTSIKYGTTPLHSAVERGRYTMVELLVSKGAACNATNKGGLTPLDLAEQKNREEIAALLRAACQ
ncbi:MAG: ankyrin repeat domain-containing protein [Planctomycetota bacterium]|jgi:ankyrin repeat protein